MTEYVSPTWVDKSDPSFDAETDPALKAANLQVLSDAVEDHGGRIATAEGDITSISSGLDTAEDDITTLQGDVSGLTMSVDLLTAGPGAFHVTKSGNQATGGPSTFKVTFDTYTIDTRSWFDHTNNRYTPQVAGRYLLYGSVAVTAAVADQTRMFATIEKNGVTVATLGVAYASGSDDGLMVGGSCLVDMNGSTDYAELFAQVNAASVNIGGGATTKFGGCLVERA